MERENVLFLGPYLSKLPTELILEIGWFLCASSQKNYLALLLTCRHLHDLCKLTCLPAVPVVLKNPNATARFAEYLASDSTLAPRVHRLWIASDAHAMIIRKCVNLVSLTCDGHDLVSLCCTTNNNNSSKRGSVIQGRSAEAAAAAGFLHTRLEDVTIMGLWDFWTQFVNAPYARTLCRQLRRLWLLDHLFLYGIEMGWLSSLKELAYWSSDMTGDQGRFRNERAVLRALPGLSRLRVLMWSPRAWVVAQAQKADKEGRLEVESLEEWMLSQQS